jgi:hypothetical protein
MELTEIFAVEFASHSQEASKFRNGIISMRRKAAALHFMDPNGPRSLCGHVLVQSSFDATAQLPCNFLVNFHSEQD